MTIPDPTYITADEIRAQTLITGLDNAQTISDENVEKLISIAEQQIDDYVGPQKHHYADSTIERVFPREQDYYIAGSTSGPVPYPDTPEVPLKVSLACLRQVEWLYTQWWTNRATKTLPSEKEVTAESIGGDGSYSADYANGGLGFTQSSLCDQARKLLQGFVSRFTGISVTDPDTSPPIE